jgi:hypothetical protein
MCLQTARVALDRVAGDEPSLEDNQGLETNVKYI